MANIITGTRIVISVVMLFCPALSQAFFIFYITAGVTDMVDGALARKTGTVSEFGARFDTVADIIFVVVCLIKLLPKVNVSLWIYIWIIIIAFIKVGNIAVVYIRRKEFIAVHTIMNKVTGAILFVFPLTLPFIDIRYSAVFVCMVATVAAINELYLVRNIYKNQDIFVSREKEHERNITGRGK